MIKKRFDFIVTLFLRSVVLSNVSLKSNAIHPFILVPFRSCPFLGPCFHYFGLMFSFFSFLFVIYYL
jgi:hypothetical protein